MKLYGIHIWKISFAGFGWNLAKNKPKMSICMQLLFHKSFYRGDMVTWFFFEKRSWGVLYENKVFMTVALKTKIPPGLLE